MNRALFVVLLLAPAIVSADALEDGKRSLQSRQYKDAIALLGDPAKAEPTGEASYCLAVAYDLSGELTKAIDQYRLVAAGTGKRAPEAQRYLQALEKVASEAAAAAKTRSEIERTALEGSQRLKDARVRVETALTSIAAGESEVRKKEREKEAAIASAAEAKQETARATTRLASWKDRALLSPAGRGGVRRAGSMVAFALSGVGLGLSLWYARTGDEATSQINNPNNSSWSEELDWYVKWGRLGDERLPYTLSIGGGLFVAGSVLLGSGEMATNTPEEASTVTAIEAAR